MQFSNFSYRCQVDNIAELMVHSDLAIGAGGTTAWERCAMGLPSIMISVANNQDSICSYLQKAGAAFFLGKQEFVSMEDLLETLIKLLGDKKKIHSMSNSAFSLVDALGTKRVVDTMLENQTIKQ